MHLNGASGHIQAHCAKKQTIEQQNFCSSFMRNSHNHPFRFSATVMRQRVCASVDLEGLKLKKSHTLW